MTWTSNAVPSLFYEMDRLFDVFGGKAYEPEKKDLHIEYAFPGIPKKNISIKVEDNTLTINVDHERAKFAKKVATDIHDLNKVNANYEDGLLTIDVPLKIKPKSATKSIEIKGP